MRRRWAIGIGVVLALLALLVVDALVVDGQTESAHVTVPGGRILDLPDGELQGRENGPRSGSPTPLIPCFSGARAWWDGILPLLKRKHRVIAVDLLGHGGSEKPASGYTPQNQAKVVAEALESLRMSDATVVGHSLGGAVTVALAQEHPRLVGRAV